MSNLPDDPTPALLQRIHQNVTALGCAIGEIGLWIDQHDSSDVSGRITDHLKVLANNTDTIATLMADLEARWTPEDEIDPED